ncbi:glycogen debranching enzyme GlgX [Gulosibacter macacae]|uniref:Glycogen debranching enzyme GlgX n=1 Tax=Gulosibacter macacae TaxID=2488791 RepID=A0A3P3VTG6_9MICO|nr:glycogen debranching protein GlgX [Gulosibacter macacae]RRJ86075.1 glycogen debranching enzyme GlgX [Gulosibacter macacae]
MTASTTLDLGVIATPEGPRLRVWSRHATSMTLVLFDDDAPVATLPMGRDGDVWEVATPELHPGRRYALRVDGPQGGPHRFDPTLDSLDPYARHIENVGTAASPHWLSVVVADEQFDWGTVSAPETPLRDTVIYEAHVKGLTQLAPFVPEHLRGTYAGLASTEMIAHLKRLGITAIELLPVHAFDSERHLRAQDMTNYWGYNTLGFFAPHAAYATEAARAEGPEAVAREFKGMVRLLHEAGIEVYLDVVYNHTADEGIDAPPRLFRGLDNASYYRHDLSGRLLDVTGCGNSVDASKPIVQQLIIDSLRYWHEEFGIDGFRFDLAVTLGRDAHHSFSTHHPLLTAIANDERLEGVKMIAEPWDVGVGGWQTGHFPPGWSEWNDEYRDRVRRFWVESFAQARITGQHREGVGKLTTAMAGSSNRFSDARGPIASVNFVTAHDGFTMRDLVSYNVKHNLLNGELNRDGTGENHSYNFGFEGETSDDRINALRRLSTRNLVGTLLLSAGVPMLVAGDEIARTQDGNNNPYNQDNETGWVDWSTFEYQTAHFHHVRRLLEIRHNYPVLRPVRYNHTTEIIEGASRLDWFDALGGSMDEWEWNSPATRSVQYLASTRTEEGDIIRVLVVVHGVEDPAPFRLPKVDGIEYYRLLWDSAVEHIAEIDTDAMSLVVPGQRMRVTGPSMRVYEVIGSD